jgi:DNA-directed RNA polymerase subunit N (RpoN/RPB10)
MSLGIALICCFVLVWKEVKCHGEDLPLKGNVVLQESAVSNVCCKRILVGHTFSARETREEDVTVLLLELKPRADDIIVQ